MRETLERAGRTIVLVAAAFLAACAGLPGGGRPAAADHVYVLDAVPHNVARREPTGVVLIVRPAQAPPGYDTERMIYMTREHELGAFAHSRWAEAPARMLGPILFQGLQQTGAFASVIAGPTTASGNVQLETELVRLQHEFLERPSRVRIVLRAALVDTATSKLIASRRFEDTEPADQDTPYGGVLAANRLVARVLARIAQFSAEQAAHIRTSAP